MKSVNFQKIPSQNSERNAQAVAMNSANYWGMYSMQLELDLILNYANELNLLTDVKLPRTTRNENDLHLQSIAMR